MTVEHAQSLDMAFDKGLQLAFPPVMVRLLKALLEPEPSFSEIAGYLEMDPMLAAKVLHIVNTTGYGFSEKFTSLHRAAIAIGTADLFKLIISLSLQKKLYSESQRDPKLILGDWRLTLWSAQTAEAIAAILCPKFKQVAYLGGMLKDLPLFLAFCRHDIPPFLQGPRLATLPAAGQSANELAYWGSDHAELAHDILVFWGFPAELAEAVRAHHEYSGGPGGRPLTKSLAYATRWAELLLAPDGDPGQLVAFELALAAELGLDLKAMEEFRAACWDKFNLLTSQLELKAQGADTRLHEQSLANIQSYYFLALGALGDISPQSTKTVAVTLQRQLRLFWGVNTWELQILLPGATTARLFRCESGTVRTKEQDDSASPSVPQRWVRYAIASSDNDYGYLAIPPGEGGEGESTLPMFVHMLAMCLDENRKRSTGAALRSRFASIPFLAARLDVEGRIREASDSFLDALGLQETPLGRRAEELLKEHLGMSQTQYDAAAKPGEPARGTLLSVPEGRFPGTPVYLSRCLLPGRRGESVLLLGDVTHLGALQALALGHPDFMSALFEGIRERICLLDEEGDVIWAGTGVQPMLEKNIFSLFTPESPAPERWDAGLLAYLSDPLRVRATRNGQEEPGSYELLFSPLVGRVHRQFLLILNNETEREAMAGESVSQGGAKSRDPLTGLYGYTQFHALLAHFSDLSAKDNSQVGVLFCDIEDLHGINEKYGYQKGDAALRGVAGVLAAAVRPGQDHPCRYSSDKFAVLVNRATEHLMNGMAGQIQLQAAAIHDVPVRLNIGIALMEPAREPKHGLDAAREACKKAARTETRILWAE